MITKSVLANLLLQENSEYKFTIRVLFGIFGKRILLLSIWKT